MGQHFESAKTRIRNINWEYEDRFRPSHVSLFIEYLRRGNIFLDHIHKDPTKRSVFFRATREIGAELPINIEEICSDIDKITKNGLTKVHCTYYLEWAYLIDQEVPIALQFHDLYEPVIRFYEGGGRISLHHGELICGLNGLSRYMPIFKKHSPLDLREEALVKEDNQWYYDRITYLLEQFGENLNLGELGKGETTSLILDQLQKYNHATSKILIIYIEVAKKLLTNGIYDTQTLKEIKVEIENFRMYDEEEIPEPERQVVSVQVEDILNKISGKVE